MDVLAGATGTVADLGQRFTVDQIGADAVKCNRSAQPPIFNAGLVSHPEEQTTNGFERKSAGFLAWVDWFDKE